MLALRYAVYGLVWGAPATVLWPWGSVLLWPALGWMCLAAGHAGLGARVWGRRALPQRLLMWPVRRLVQWCHARRRDDVPPVEITPGLWFGQRLTAVEATRWLPRDVAVLDVAPEYGSSWAVHQPAHLAVDLLQGSSPAPLDLLVCTLFIDMHRERGVYIQGALGLERAPLVAACWLLRRYQRLQAAQAEEMLGTKRSAIRFSARQRAVLDEVRALQQQGDTVAL